MPRTFAQLITMVRRRLGWPSTDTFVSDDEIANMLLESRRELFDFMVSVHQGAYRVVFTTFDTVANQPVYTIQHNIDGTLGDIIGEKIERIVRMGVFLDGENIPIRPWTIENESYRTDSVTWERGVDMRYHVTSGVLFGEMLDRIIYLTPVPANVVTIGVMCNVGPSGTESVSLTGTVNDLGHDEYLVLDCMIKCLQMEETDASSVMAQKERLIQRIQNEASPIDAGQAPTIQDVRARDGTRWL